MARDFDGSGDKLNYAGAIVSVPAFTMSCWFNPRNVTADHWLMTICTDASGNQYHALVANGALAGDELNAWTRTTSSVNAGSGTAFVADKWQHGCGVWAAGNSRAVFLDGTKGTDTGSRNPTGMDTTRVGADSSSANVLNGLIAEPCIWDVALTDAEVLMLASGAHPWTIRPNHIVAYWPCYGLDSPEPDFSGAGHPLTLTNTTRADHPPKLSAYQPSRLVQRVRAVAWEVALTGELATGSAGTLAVSGSTALTGLEATGQAGALLIAGSAALAGVSATGSIGGVYICTSCPIVTGVETTAAAGTLAPSGALALTGQEATGAPGTLGAGYGASLAGAEATGAAGSLAPSLSLALSGAVGTGAAGTLSPAFAGGVGLTGVSADALVGTLAPVTAVVLTGQSATGNIGTLSPGFGWSQALTGQESTGQIGTFGMANSMALGGLEATGAAGILTPVLGLAVGLTGLEATGAAGTLGLSFVPLQMAQRATAAMPGSITVVREG